MNYEIKQTINSEDFIRIRKMLKWNTIDAHQVKRALDNSMYNVSILIDGKCIGVGRIVGDNELFQLEASPTANNREFYIKCGLKYKPTNQDGVYIWIRR